MTIKVARTIMGNLLAVGVGNPFLFLMPIMVLILVIPVGSVITQIADRNAELAELDFANSTAVDEYEASISSSLFPILLLPILLMAILIPFITTGVSGGSANVRGIIKTANIEKRMEKLKKLGAAEFVKQTHATLIDSSARGNKLWGSRDIIQGKHLKFLIYQDKSTPREYISFVPNHFSNADEAMAWKFGLSNIEYDKLSVENEA